MIRNSSKPSDRRRARSAFLLALFVASLGGVACSKQKSDAPAAPSASAARADTRADGKLLSESLAIWQRRLSQYEAPPPCNELLEDGDERKSCEDAIAALAKAKEFAAKQDRSQAAIQAAAELARSATMLDAEKISCRGPRWHKFTLYRVLRRAGYQDPERVRKSAPSKLAPWKPSVGSHNVTAVPYLDSNFYIGSGTGLRVAFNVVRNVVAPPQPPSPPPAPGASPTRPRSPAYGAPRPAPGPGSPCQR